MKSILRIAFSLSFFPLTELTELTERVGKEQKEEKRKVRGRKDLFAIISSVKERLASLEAAKNGLSRVERK